MNACPVLLRDCSRYISSAIAIALFAGIPSHAIAMTPAVDGTGTQIVKTGDLFDISGGTLSGDGANLFHSFEQFGLNANEIANFLSSPQVQNILGRVTGGAPSIINGLIQITGGNSNLYLMNPAGIVFGQGASLNVGGDFFATTATGIGFNGNWFEAMGSNDYGALNGNPTQFAFDLANAGTIVNGGNLGVNTGQNLTLLGGSVVNTGNLTAEGGNIAIAAVPGTSLVRISHPNNVLSLEVEPPRDAEGNLVAFDAFDLPELLTGALPEVTTNLAVAGQTVKTLAGTIVPTVGGTAIASGTIDVSSEVGGNIDILGDRVALLDNALLDASGDFGGGKVRLGGGYQGQENVYNADYTYVSPNASIVVDALLEGNGGIAIAWADKTTRFHGEVRAKGGTIFGHGGFVEISGKRNLIFTGDVDVSASRGNNGTILFDPQNITVERAAASADDSQLNANNPNGGDPQGAIFSNDGVGDFTISDTQLSGLTGTIILQATGNITFNTDVDFTGLESLQANMNLLAGGNITIGADLELQLNQNFSAVADGNISVQGIADDGTSMGNISLTSNNGGIVANGNLITSTFSGNGGSVTLQAANNIQVESILASGTVSLNSTNGDINIGSNNGNEIRSGVFANGAPGQVNLMANNGLIALNGWVRSGRNGKAGDSTINITAARFRAINPFSGQLLDVASFKTSGATDASDPGVLVATPTSLLATPASVNFATQNQIDQVTVDNIIYGKTVLTFADDPNPIEVGSGSTLISINLLEDTTFSVNQTLGSTGSGTEGLIAITAAGIPPTVVVLLGDGNFSATIPQLDTGMGATATTITPITAPPEVASTSSTLNTEATTAGQTLEQSSSGCNSINSSAANNDICEVVEQVEPRSLLTIEE